MNGKIYLIRNLINGKCYVGQTIGSIENRFNEHKFASKNNSKCALHRAIRKYGEENFTINEVVNCEVLLLNDLEKHYIKFYGTFAPTGHGYNLTKGGDGNFGWIPSEETRAKMSASQKGKILSPEHRAKLSALQKGKNKGKVLSPEHRAKMSASMMGKNKGKSHKVTDETRAKMSASMMGKNKGKTPSLETRAKMSGSAKSRERTRERNGRGQYV
jgi:group I intron endonuclease